MASVAFDHLMIAAADLDAARDRYLALGYDVRQGGEHAGVGTANLIVPFDDGRYVEVIGVRDAAQARVGLADGERFVALLETYEEIPMIFVLRAGELDALAQRLTAAGVAVEGPDRLSRKLPDGRVARCAILRPRRGPWRVGLPSYIDWGDTPHPAAQPGRHRNGARRLTGLEVLVDDLDEQIAPYAALGCTVERHRDGHGASVDLAGFSLALVTEGRSEEDRAAYAAHGVGVSGVVVEGRDDAARPTTPGRPFRWMHIGCAP